MNSADDTKSTPFILAQPDDYWKETVRRKASETAIQQSFAIALAVLDHLDATGTKRKDLAASLDMSPQQLNTLLKGNREMALSTINRLELATGLSLLKRAAEVALEEEELTMCPT